MDYMAHYERLIEKHGSWIKPKGVYTERHRKIPGCMGGKYVEGNAFHMSARAHFVAHLLLARIYDISPLWNAIVSMGGLLGKTTSSSYEAAKLKAMPILVENGIRARNNKIGFHAWTESMWIEHGKRSLELKIGIFGPNANPREAGRLGGKEAFRNGTGIHNFETRSKAGKLGGAKTGKALGLQQSKIRRKCETCGMVASPATLGAHQKAKNHTGWVSV